METASLRWSWAWAMAPLCGPPGLRLADDVHRIGGELFVVSLHRDPERRDRDRLEVGAPVAGQRGRCLGVGDGIQGWVVVAEVEGKARDQGGGAPLVCTPASRTHGRGV